MSRIAANSRVHLVATATNDKRCYLAKLGTKRNKRGELVLDAQFDDDAHQSQSLPYENAVIVKRRLRDEHNIIVGVSQSAGDSAELLEE
jgi:hypothetical protein